MFQRILYALKLSFFRVSFRRKFFFYLIILFLAVVGIFRTFFSDFIEVSNLPFIKFIDLFLLYLFIAVGLNFVKLFIMSTYRKRNKIQVGTIDNTIKGIENVYRMILILICLLATLYYSGIHLLTFFTTFALVSVAFSWLFKEYIANIIDGLLIIFSDDFKIGDYIKVNDFKGRIKDIRFMNTKIMTDEGDVVFIPNTLLFQREVVNYSKVKFKRIIYEFEIDKSLFPKVRKVEKSILKNLQKEFVDIIEDDKFTLKVNKIHHQGASLSAEIPVKKYDFSTEYLIEKNISLSVMEFIDKEEDN
ncbi:MAG: mechanosensitive ion channel family protein [Nanoarchaeota archaeon]|nr:mechanosensitive ion channel family protein [Nanoarchaeota archaeon]